MELILRFSRLQRLEFVVEGWTSGTTSHTVQWVGSGLYSRVSSVQSRGPHLIWWGIWEDPAFRNRRAVRMIHCNHKHIPLSPARKTQYNCNMWWNHPPVYFNSSKVAGTESEVILTDETRKITSFLQKFSLLERIAMLFHRQNCRLTWFAEKHVVSVQPVCNIHWRVEERNQQEAHLSNKR